MRDVTWSSRHVHVWFEESEAGPTRSWLWPRDEAVVCRDVVELLTAYLEGALAPSAAALLRTHVGGCVGCRLYLEQLQATVPALGAAPLPTLSEQTCLELLAAFRAQRSPQGTSP